MHRHNNKKKNFHLENSRVGTAEKGEDGPRFKSPQHRGPAFDRKNYENKGCAFGKTLAAKMHILSTTSKQFSPLFLD